MNDILRAMGRALQSLMQKGVFWHLVWPSIVALIVWLVVAVLSWSRLIAAIMNWLEQWPFISQVFSWSDISVEVTLILVKIFVFLAFLPLFYVTATLLVSMVALPLMLEKVVRHRYADLEERHGGSMTGSMLNTFIALALFILALVLSLPFWLIPGVSVIVPVLLTGWMNQRMFSYDALMLHADADELVKVRKSERIGMTMLGSLCATLAYIPFINLLAPAFSGLAAMHFMLEALRRERYQHGVLILDPHPIKNEINLS